MMNNISLNQQQENQDQGVREEQVQQRGGGPSGSSPHTTEGSVVEIQVASLVDSLTGVQLQGWIRSQGGESTESITEETAEMMVAEAA